MTQTSETKTTANVLKQDGQCKNTVTGVGAMTTLNCSKNGSSRTHRDRGRGHNYTEML